VKYRLCKDFIEYLIELIYVHVVPFQSGLITDSIGSDETGELL
jgi:hypothetical protein